MPDGHHHLDQSVDKQFQQNRACSGWGNCEPALVMWQVSGRLSLLILPDEQSREPDDSFPEPKWCLQDWWVSGTSSQSSVSSRRYCMRGGWNQVLRRMNLLCWKPFVRRMCLRSQVIWHSCAHHRDAAHIWSGLSSSVAMLPHGCSAIMLLRVVGTRCNWCANPQTLPTIVWPFWAKFHPEECYRWPMLSQLSQDNVLPFVSLSPAVAYCRQQSERLL